MIEFFGTPLLGKISPDAEQTNLAALCGVSEARAEVFVNALMTAKNDAFVEQERVLMPGMASVMGQHFNLGLLLQNAQLDADTPSEILLIGLLIGRIYTEMEARAAESNKRVNKMIALLKENPAKALRKMQKEISKSLSAQK